MGRDKPTEQSPRARPALRRRVRKFHTLSPAAWDKVLEAIAQLKRDSPEPPRAN